MKKVESSNLVFLSKKLVERAACSWPVEYVEINGIDIPFSIIPEDVVFDGESNENRNLVLVKKGAMSCNYREKAYLLMSHQQINQKSEEQNKGYFLPFGSEFSGRIVATGKNVSNLRIGDHVIGNGHYGSAPIDDEPPGLPSNSASTQYEILHYAKVLKIDATMSPGVAASFSLGAQTAGSMVRKSGIRPGDTALVTAGSSNTSLFIINALRSIGAEYCVTTTSQQNVEKLRQLGAKEAFVLSKEGPLQHKESLEAIMSKTGGVDYVFDPFFDIYLEGSLKLMKMGGFYVTCGVYNQFSFVNGARSAIKVDLTQVLQFMILKNLRITGNCLGTTSDLERALSDFKKGKLDVTIDSEYELNHHSSDKLNVQTLAKFLNRSFNDKERFGKVSLNFM